MNRIGRCALAVGLVVATSCSGQAPPTIEQSLAKEGIGTSHEALIQALHNPNRSVRGGAAILLAQQGDKSIIPDLLEGLRQTGRGVAPLDIARALSLLRDPRGETTFANVCTDNTLRSDDRLNAAGDLHSTNARCLESVAHILASDPDPSMQEEAMDILNRSDMELHPSSGMYRDVLLGVERALLNENPYMRQEAATCIAHYRLTAARASLKRAARQETDPHAQAAMRAAEAAISK